MKNWLTFKNISLSLIGVIIFAALVLFALDYTNKDQSDEQSNNSTTNVDEDNKPSDNKIYEDGEFKLELNYVGDRTWEYILTGELPNPCYSYSVKRIIGTSSPEVVATLVIVTEPSPDTFCSEVVQEISETGTFTASAEARFKLGVRYKALDQEPSESKVYEVEPFKVELNYAGNSTWEYTLTGYVPTPCHSYSNEITVMESYPEQVRMLLTVTEPSPDTMCIQVIEEISETGTFSASPEAKFELVVE